jgi:ribosome maturation factor RimP
MNGSSRQSPARPGNRASQPPAAGSADVAELTRLLLPVINAAGMDLENVRVTAVGRRRLLRVVVDGDGGVTLDDITQISRAVSAELDENGAMGETPYTLEVSSPGADRPLTEPRHWRRAAGRLVRVPLTGRAKAAGKPGHPAAVEGRVLGTSDSGVLLDLPGGQREFGYSELGPGKILLEFGHVTADADGGETDGH